MILSRNLPPGVYQIKGIFRYLHFGIIEKNAIFPEWQNLPAVAGHGVELLEYQAVFLP